MSNLPSGTVPYTGTGAGANGFVTANGLDIGLGHMYPLGISQTTRPSIGISYGMKLNPPQLDEFRFVALGTSLKSGPRKVLKYPAFGPHVKSLFSEHASNAGLGTHHFSKHIAEQRH